jgi:hypothetical protein
MQPEWKRTSSSVLWFTSANIARETFARSKLTMDAIQQMHADYYDLPDDTHYIRGIREMK